MFPFNCTELAGHQLYKNIPQPYIYLFLVPKIMLNGHKRGKKTAKVQKSFYKTERFKKC